MSVSVLNDWAGQTAGKPTGSLTISAGSGRVLWVVYFAELSGTHTFTSITVGGQSPTTSKVEESADHADTFIWSWFWDEAAIAAMSGTTLTLTESGTPSKHDWDYIVFQGALDGAEYATSVDIASADTADITTTSASTSDDFLAVAFNRTAASRDVTDYDTLTQGWQFNTDYSIGVADGAGGDDTTTLTGDGISDDWFVQLLHMKAGTSGMLIRQQHEGLLNG